MGWSCRVDAHNTLDKWYEVCKESSGMSTTYTAKGIEYFFEVSRTEHADGAITGQVYRNLTRNPDGSGTCIRAGSFRIEGNGEVKRYPTGLKTLIPAEELKRQESFKRRQPSFVSGW